MNIDRELISMIRFAKDIAIIAENKRKLHGSLIRPEEAMANLIIENDKKEDSSKVEKLNIVGSRGNRIRRS